MTYDPEDQAECRRLGGLLHESAELGMKGWGPKFVNVGRAATQLAKFLQFSTPGPCGTLDGRRGEHEATSAILPKADIGTQSRNVRFVPKADSCSAA